MATDLLAVVTNSVQKMFFGYQHRYCRKLTPAFASKDILSVGRDVGEPPAQTGSCCES